MKILQTPISDKHKSAMFFDGCIAVNGNKRLVTYNTGEIYFMGNIHAGNEIIELGQQGLINDDDIEEAIYNDGQVDILVDKFFAISTDNIVDEDNIFSDYDEAINEFKKLSN